MDQCYAQFDTVTQAEKRILTQIHQNPQTRPLLWQDVITLFTGLGAAHRARNGDVVLVLGGLHQGFHPMGLALQGDQTNSLRHFMQRCGWQSFAEAAAVDFLLMLDGFGAQIHPVMELGNAESSHLVTYLDRNQPDFFPTILAALEGGGRVLVVSPDSREFFDHIAGLDRDLRARFHFLTNSDMTTASLPYCLAVARDALAEHVFGQIDQRPI